MSTAVSFHKFVTDTDRTDTNGATEDYGRLHDNSTQLPRGAHEKNHPVLRWVVDQLQVGEKEKEGAKLTSSGSSRGVTGGKGLPGELDKVPHGTTPLTHSSRRKGWHSKPQSEKGFKAFFSSAEVDKWLLLIFTLPGFLLLHFVLLEWPSKTRYHFVALLIWLWIALIFNTLVFSSMGIESGFMWTSGYLLEVIFSLENIFVFHIIVNSLAAPRQHTQWALFIVICGQIIFEFIFFVGLADYLRSLYVLPYILGAWLLFVGIQAAFNAHDDQDESNPEEVDGEEKKTGLLQTFKTILGDRLQPTWGEECHCFVTDAEDGKTRLTLLGLLVFLLLLADFGLEVDVTLTKIEDIENSYLCFSSSVVATFAMPNLFFIAEDLFERYFALKYGIAIVVIFLGLQMLAHTLFMIPALANCGILMGVIIICIIVSDIISSCTTPKTEDSETGIADAEAVPEAMDEKPDEAVKEKV